MPKMTKIQLLGLHAGGGPETRLPIGVALYWLPLTSCHFIVASTKGVEHVFTSLMFYHNVIKELVLKPYNALLHVLLPG